MATLYEATGFIDLRVGTVEGFSATRATQAWQRVPFDPPFPPGLHFVVNAQIQTFNGRETPGLRIQQVTNTGFYARIDELVGANKELTEGHHVPETLGFVAYAFVGQNHNGGEIDILGNDVNPEP